MNQQHAALMKFGYQIRFALNNYKLHGLKADQFNNIMIGGLGGSGIGGRIVKSLFADKCPLPVECIADYSLPNWVNDKTLVILGSYSGNTEETLNMYSECAAKGCKVTILTGGGKLLELAKSDGIHLNIIEGGYQPRMALGFSLTYLCLIFAELLDLDITNEIEETASTFDDTKVYHDEAESIFNSIKSKITQKLVVLTDGFFEPIGIRFAQQVQENAKHECFVHTLPEMNHNVIESYYGQVASIFFMLDAHKNHRVSARFEFVSNLLEVENNRVVHVPVEETNIKAVYEIIHMLDWLSILIADFRKVDSLNVPNIMSLKEFLESVN